MTLALIGIFSLIISGCLAGGAASGDTTGSLTISGELTYLPRVALPPGSIAIVELRADAERGAEVLGEQRIELGRRQVPIDFELTVAAERLRGHDAPVFRGGIVHRGQPIWLTALVPIEGSSGSVELGALRMTTHRPEQRREETRDMSPTGAFWCSDMP